MIDIIGTIVCLLLLFIGLPILILRLRDRVTNTRSQRRNTPEKLAAERGVYEERLLNFGVFIFRKPRDLGYFPSNRPENVPTRQAGFVRRSRLQNRISA